MVEQDTNADGRAVVNVAAYTRVSTSEQADSGAGLDAQRRALADEAARRGWVLVEVFEDAGASGKSMAGRPGLEAALAAVESGRADVLAVAKLDRLSRSVHDFAGLVARAQRKGWSLVALDLPGMDMTTPVGGLLANIVASVAEWERKTIGQRTKDALAVKRAQGVRLGRPRTMCPQAVQLIGELRAEGRSYRAIAETLNERGIPTAQGGKRWHAETVRMAALRYAA